MSTGSVWSCCKGNRRLCLSSAPRTPKVRRLCIRRASSTLNQGKSASGDSRKRGANTVAVEFQVRELAVLHSQVLQPLSMVNGLQRQIVFVESLAESLVRMRAVRCAAE